MGLASRPAASGTAIKKAFERVMAFTPVMRATGNVRPV
jgi:hypothetical protein